MQFGSPISEQVDAVCKAETAGLTRMIGYECNKFLVDPSVSKKRLPSSSRPHQLHQNLESLQTSLQARSALTAIMFLASRPHATPSR